MHMTSAETLPPQQQQQQCIISLGIDGPLPADHPTVIFQDFARGLRRLRHGLTQHGYRGEIITWDREYPADSPTVAQAHCAFKPYCFAEARRRGHRYVLWLDASVVIKRPLAPLFERIARDGYLFFTESHSVGEYCKDAALQPLGITREESFRLPSCWGCAMGLDVESPCGAEFLRRWMALAGDGVTFPGPKWSGVRGWPRAASLDARVKGHRFDQTAASVVAIKLGMSRWRPQSEFCRFFTNDRAVVRRYQEDV